MGDIIQLKNIRAFGKHGAKPGERDVEQAFDIELEISLDLSKACSSDNLADTVDYSKIHKQIVQIVKEKSFLLLERLADQILQELFADPRIHKVKLSISKPGIHGYLPTIVMERTNPKV